MTTPTWDELASCYCQQRDRKRGSSLRPKTIQSLHRAIQLVEPFSPSPEHLSKSALKQALNHHRDAGSLSETSLSSYLRLLSSAVNVAIKDDLLCLEVNPFSLVDIGAAQREGSGYRSLSDGEVRELLQMPMGEVWYVLLGTGLRVGELWSRRESHLDGRILTITDKDSRDEWKPKTRSSYRRVPLSPRADAILDQLLPIDMNQYTFADRLRREIKQLRCDESDARLVTHSTRHTYVTWTRRVGMPLEISEQLTGHSKSQGSRIHDCYGSWPDEVLEREGRKIWDFLITLS